MTSNVLVAYYNSEKYRHKLLFIGEACPARCSPLDFDT